MLIWIIRNYLLIFVSINEKLTYFLIFDDSSEILLIISHVYNIEKRRIMNVCEFPTNLDLIKQIQLFDYSYLFIISVRWITTLGRPPIPSRCSSFQIIIPRLTQHYWIIQTLWITAILQLANNCNSNRRFCSLCAKRLTLRTLSAIMLGWVAIQIRIWIISLNSILLQLYSP